MAVNLLNRPDRTHWCFAEAWLGTLIREDQYIAKNMAFSHSHIEFLCNFRFGYPGPVPGGVQRAPPEGIAFFAPLFTRREKNWGGCPTPRVEEPHFFAPWRALDKGGRLVSLRSNITSSSHIFQENGTRFVMGVLSWLTPPPCVPSLSS